MNNRFSFELDYDAVDQLVIAALQEAARDCLKMINGDLTKSYVREDLIYNIDIAQKMNAVIEHFGGEPVDLADADWTPLSELEIDFEGDEGVEFAKTLVQALKEAADANAVKSWDDHGPVTVPPPGSGLHP